MKAARLSDVGPGSPRQAEAEGHTVALFNVGGTVYALDDRCPHQGCPLSDGDLDGTTLTCTCHGSQFDVTSGALRRGPATRDAKSYAVRVSGTDVEIEV